MDGFEVRRLWGHELLDVGAWGLGFAVSDFFKLIRGRGLTMEIGIRLVRLLQIVLLLRGRIGSWQTEIAVAGGNTTHEQELEGSGIKIIVEVKQLEYQFKPRIFSPYLGNSRW